MVIEILMIGNDLTLPEMVPMTKLCIISETLQQRLNQMSFAFLCEPILHGKQRNILSRICMKYMILSVMTVALRWFFRESETGVERESIKTKLFLLKTKVNYMKNGMLWLQKLGLIQLRI